MRISKFLLFSFILFLCFIISSCSEEPDSQQEDIVFPQIEIQDDITEDAILQPKEQEPLIVPYPTIIDSNNNADIEQPPFLTECLEQSSLAFNDLECSQLILVSSENTSATIFCYDCIDGLWLLKSDISYLNGYVGKHGISNNHIEGDGTTPSGLFTLGFAFGNKPNPGTELEYRDIMADDYWVSDPDSPLYNTWVSGTDGYDVKKAEHLSAYTNSYAYSIVIEYNMPMVIPYAGSAIFLHCGAAPTSGCVSLSEYSMVEILKWVKPGAKILIL